MSIIYPKKKLGQHFLHDEKIAKKIVQNLSLENCSSIVELGPGMGLLTNYLIDKYNDLFVLEKDTEYVKYLHTIFPSLKSRIINMDFIQNIPILSSFALIGNFPYNISSNILFFLIKNRSSIQDCIGMFQKQVVERITSNNGNKNYGILSVLLQTFYDIKYVFTVPNDFLSPTPNVKSSVIHLHKKAGIIQKVNESIFFNIVKVSFNQRRKKLRNTLKPLNFSKSFYEKPILQLRAEQLSVQQFIQLSYQTE